MVYWFIIAWGESVKLRHLETENFLAATAAGVLYTETSASNLASWAYTYLADGQVTFQHEGSGKYLCSQEEPLLLDSCDAWAVGWDVAFVSNAHEVMAMGTVTLTTTETSSSSTSSTSTSSTSTTGLGVRACHLFGCCCCCGCGARRSCVDLRALSLGLAVWQLAKILKGLLTRVQCGLA